MFHYIWLHQEIYYYQKQTVSKQTAVCMKVLILNMHFFLSQQVSSPPEDLLVCSRLYIFFILQGRQLVWKSYSLYVCFKVSSGRYRVNQTNVNLKDKQTLYKLLNVFIVLFSNDHISPEHV